MIVDIRVLLKESWNNLSKEKLVFQNLYKKKTSKILKIITMEEIQNWLIKYFQTYENDWKRKLKDLFMLSALRDILKLSIRRNKFLV